MKRQTSFRGIAKGTNEWVYGDLYRTPEREATFREPPSSELLWHIASGHSISYPLIIVEPDSVGECTGVQDKQYNKIYEGDIVAVDRSEGHWIAEVQWNEQAAGFYLTNGKRYRDILSCAQSKVAEEMLMLDKVTVIGNIHQHSHLLTK